jgi:hypothetical protein
VTIWRALLEVFSDAISKEVLGNPEVVTPDGYKAFGKDVMDHLSRASDLVGAALPRISVGSRRKRA